MLCGAHLYSLDPKLRCCCYCCTYFLVHAAASLLHFSLFLYFSHLCLFSTKTKLAKLKGLLRVQPKAVSYEDFFPRNFGAGRVKKFPWKISSGAQSEHLGPSLTIEEFFQENIPGFICSIFRSAREGDGVGWEDADGRVSDGWPTIFVARMFGTQSRERPRRSTPHNTLPKQNLSGARLFADR